MSEYYVRSTGGSDGNTGLTFAQGWSTLAYAFSNSSANDILYICSTEASPFSLTSTWTVTSEREYIGCDLTDGSPYNGTGKAHIKKTSGTATMVQTTTVNKDTLWQDICFDGNNTTYNVFTMNGTVDTYNYMFRNCDFKDSYDRGVKISITSTLGVRHYSVCFHNCNIYGHYFSGLYVDQPSGSCLHVVMSNCSIYDNGYHNIQFDVPASLSLFNCRVFTSSSAGIYLGNIDGHVNVQHSIIALNSSHGIQVSVSDSVNRLNIFNSIIAHNGGWGIYKASNNALWASASHNCFYDNTSGNLSSYINSGVLTGYGNVTTDPLFESIVSGSEDFSLQSTSPCLNAGYGYEGGK